VNRAYRMRDGEWVTEDEVIACRRCCDTGDEPCPQCDGALDPRCDWCTGAGLVPCGCGLRLTLHWPAPLLEENTLPF
jgi:hypothetical protein